MNKADYQRLKQVVVEALELKPSLRFIFIHNELSNYPELIDKAERMISYEEDTFFKEPLSQIENQLQVPEHLNHYQIIRKIGEGGMGEVYLAQQQKPAERLVAIKFITANLNKEQLFAECQVLARLNHANIATLYEADTLDKGTLYIVMEYIDGLDLISWMRACDRSLDEKIKLFKMICAGISHAHQKGVIHCDIKPSNILVTSEGQTHHAKVIDFGISQLENESAPKTYTAGTRGYLPPECLLKEGKYDADIRRDVYALGVLFYQIIYDELPTSDYLKQKPQDDLDYIIQKAMADDINDRYETVAALNKDIKLWQNQQAITIRENERVYVFTRLIMRRKGAFLFSIGIILSLVFGYIAQSIQAKEARYQATAALNAEKKATEQAAIARIAEQEALNTAGFLTDLFDLANPERRGGEELSAVELVVLAKNRLMENETPTLSDARFMHTLGAIFTRMGDLEQATVLLNASLQTKQQFLPDNDPEVLDDMIELGVIYRRLGDTNRSKSILNQALSIANASPELFLTQRGFINNHLGNLSWHIKDFNQAIVHHKKAIEIRTELGQTNILADSYNNLGVIYRKQQNWPEASKYLNQALDIYIEVYGEQHAFVGGVKNNLSLVEENLFNWDKAEQLLYDALVSTQKKYGEKHPQSLTILRNLAFYYERRHQFNQSIDAWEKVISWHKENNSAFEFINAMGYQARVYQKMGLIKDAVTLHQDAFRQYEESALVSTKNNLKPRLLMRYGNTLFAAGDHELALQILNEANGLFLENYSKDYFNRLYLLTYMGDAYINLKQANKAREVFDEIITLAKETTLHYKHKINALIGVAQVHQLTNEYDQSLIKLQQAKALNQRIYGLNNQLSAKILYQMALAHTAKAEHAIAIDFFNQAFTMQQLVLPANHPDLLLTKTKISN